MQDGRFGVLRGAFSVRMVVAALAALCIACAAFMAAEPSHRDGNDSSGQVGAPDAYETPVCFLYYGPSSGRDGDRGGVRFAVWADGVVLLSANPNRPGENLRIAGLKGDVGALLNQMTQDGLTAIESTGYGVPDGRMIHLGAQFGDDARLYTWDEVIHRNYGKNANPDEPYRAFVRMWFMARITLESVPIESMRELSDADLVDGTFRGYDVASRSARSWIAAVSGGR